VILAALAVVVAGALGGCDTGDGRALADPIPGATAPPLPASSTTGTAAILPPVGSSEEGTPLLLGSEAFSNSQPIPERYACTGDPAGTSPPLAWAGVPPGTVELAVTVVDVSTPEQFVHWVVAGLDPNLLGIDEGSVPEGAIEARNDSSEFGWFGPCPPAGETHTYLFTLFALTAASGVVEGSGGPEALAAIAATPGIAATLSGSFTGPPADAGP
jgi:Raf kinase inhibitor-like YbhB/YbcL family protein